MSLKGKTDEEKIWNYLYEKIKNAFGVAGMMGNLYAESGLIFNRVEILCLKRLKENGKVYTDETYTKAVDDGTISRAEFLNPLPGKQYGFSLSQLTSPSRKAGLYDLCKSRCVSIADPETQLDYLYQELSTSFKTVLSALKSAKSVKEASDVVLKKFEMPADTSAAVQNTRASYGQKYYDKYAKSSTSSGVTSSSGTKTSPSAVIKIAKNEVGYLEKKSNASLDDKTANAGSNNYTKYWRDMANLNLGNYQAQYWCACFVHWCFYKAFGLTASQKLLLQNFYINCQVMYNLASSAGQIYSSPAVGDVVLFYKSGQYGHTGIVIEVSGSKFTTIEGNTSGGSTVVANGGGVAEKTYTISSLPNVKFMRPKYDNVDTSASSTPSSSSSSSSSSVTYIQKGSKGDEVKKIQKKLIKLGYSCGVSGADGDFGNDTYKAVVQFQRDHNLEVDGVVGLLTLSALKSAAKKVSSADSTSKSSDSYMVKITTDALNIRQKPNTSSKIMGVIKDRGVYTIVEESNGWGKLKSGAGWISLAYTQKL